MNQVNSRQVHLDFHTSELIPDVGRQFDAAQWQAALKMGRVNAINVFAKCHHSWSYYPTQVGRMHPTLSLDLLGAQIRACHEIGVRAPIYYTVGWSATDAATHPEWTVRQQDGQSATMNYDLRASPEERKPGTSWVFLCPSGAYREHMLAAVREICERYAVDGFWFDICMAIPCYCDNCRAGMQAAGVNTDDPAAVQGYSVDKWASFMGAANALIHAQHPEASIFYNGTTHMGDARRLHPFSTQYDLEDLPTTWGGYDKLPLRARYFCRYGKPLVAMSGKFHTSWGEFGGFKHPDALRYEAAAMIAYGARCNFGDQLHPSGAMDMATYANIGAAFDYVERIEEYGLEGEPYTTLGLWLSDNVPHDQGVANMLLETQQDFAVVGATDDLAPYRAIILTGGRCLDEAAATRLQRYVAGGGALLVLGESPLDSRGERFALDVGAEYVGPARYELDYLLAGDGLATGLVRSPILMYQAAVRCRATDGQVLAAIKEPYFDRTYGHYCSHLNTPNRPEDAPHPGAVRRGSVIYLPHALGAIYHAHGARLHRQLFANALRMIYPEPAFAAQMPSAGRVTFLHQPARRRYVAHLLYGPPLQRGRCLVIEDLVPLRDIPLRVHVPQTIRAVRLPLEGQELAATVRDGMLAVAVPQMQGHQVVLFEY